MSDATRVWFITGISRGLGQELAKAALARGDAVIGTTRSGALELPGAQRVTNAQKLQVLPLEMTDAAQVRATVAKAQSLHGRLDVVINNAGYGLFGAVEETAEAEYRHLFEVDFFAPVQVIQAALPFLRKQRSGCIVNISSIAALAPRNGAGFYSAAKSALEGVSQSLAQEMAPLGIKVMLVEPGAFRTDFLDDHSIRSSAASIGDYDATAGNLAAQMRRLSGRQMGDPARGAQLIVEAAMSAEPPMHLVIGRDALERTREKQRKLSADLERWESASLATAYPEKPG